MTSRTDGGTPSGPDAAAVSRSTFDWLRRSRTTSLAKNGLPPVSRTIAATAAGDGLTPDVAATSPVSASASRPRSTIRSVCEWRDSPASAAYSG